MAATTDPRVVPGITEDEGPMLVRIVQTEALFGVGQDGRQLAELEPRRPERVMSFEEQRGVFRVPSRRQLLFSEIARLPVLTATQAPVPQPPHGLEEPGTVSYPVRQLSGSRVHRVDFRRARADRDHQGGTEVEPYVELPRYVSRGSSGSSARALKASSRNPTASRFAERAVALAPPAEGSGVLAPALRRRCA